MFRTAVRLFSRESHVGEVAKIGPAASIIKCLQDGRQWKKDEIWEKCEVSPKFLRTILLLMHKLSSKINFTLCKLCYVVYAYPVSPPNLQVSLTVRDWSFRRRIPYHLIRVGVFRFCPLNLHDRGMHLGLKRKKRRLEARHAPLGF